MSSNGKTPALFSTEVPSLMRRAFHTRRAALALIALLGAAAFPMTEPLSHEYAPPAEVVMMDARASSDAEVVGEMPSATFTGGTTRRDGDVTQTAAMMLVGTLLIAVGSVVRRVV
jgi:hypothetical protein